MCLAALMDKNQLTCRLPCQDNDENLSQKSDSPSSIETETDSGVSLTSSENDVLTEDDLHDMSMDVSEKSLAACAGFDNEEESESIQALKGPEVNMPTDLNILQGRLRISDICVERSAYDLNEACRDFRFP